MRLSTEISNLIEITDQLVQNEGYNHKFDPQRLKFELRWALTVYLNDGSEVSHRLANEIYSQMTWSEEEEMHYWQTSSNFQDPIEDYEYPEFYKRMSKSWSRIIFLCMTLSLQLARTYRDDKNMHNLLEIASHLQGVNPEDFEEISNALIKDERLPQKYLFKRERRKRDEIAHRVDNLIGQFPLKKGLKELIRQYNSLSIRQRYGHKMPSMPHHVLLKGNPGADKASIARLLGDFFYDIGILQTPLFVAVTRTEIIGSHPVKSAQMTREKIAKALDGVLFIEDDSDILQYESLNDYGRESVAELAKLMEDYSSKLVVIMAGCPDEIENLLIGSPVLSSRFQHVLEFTDYTVDELYLKLEEFCENDGYHLNKGNQKLSIMARLLNAKHKTDSYIKELYYRAVRRQAQRIEPYEHTMPQTERNEILVSDFFPGG